MIQYLCTSCKQDASGGGSVVYGGMFFKMCAECLEDEEVIRSLNEYWRVLEEGGDKQDDIDNEIV